MKTLLYGVFAVAGLLLVSAAAQAQNSNDMDAATLAEWEYNSIYDAGGIRAEYMITEEVFGPEGEEIGNVENAIISAEGQIVAIIAEVGGFWDIADTHIAVPWEEVKLIQDGFRIPVTEDNFDDYSLFADNSFITTDSLQEAHAVGDTLATGPKTWRLTALLDDYVLLKNGAGYGYLDDVIFSKDGKIQALIVQSTVAAYGYGRYAYPYYGYEYGWQPYDNVYTLPYGPEAIGALEPFNYDMFDSYWG